MEIDHDIVAEADASSRVGKYAAGALVVAAAVALFLYFDGFFAGGEDPESPRVIIEGQ